MTGVPIPAHLRSRVVAWEYKADLTNAGAGPMRLDAEVRVDHQDWVILDSVCLILAADAETAGTHGKITNPAPGARISGLVVNVSGYAVHPDGPVKAIVVNLDGEPVARVLPCLQSPLAQRRWPDLPWSTAAGWQSEVLLGPASSRNVRLSAEALGPDDAWQPVDSITIQVASRGTNSARWLASALRSLWEQVQVASARHDLRRLVGQLARPALWWSFGRNLLGGRHDAPAVDTNPSWQAQYYAWLQMHPAEGVMTSDAHRLNSDGFGIMVDARGAGGGTAANVIASLLAQSYELWHAWIFTHATDPEPAVADARIDYVRVDEREGILRAWRRALDVAGCDWVIQAGPDDELKPDALATIAATANGTGGADLIYTDSDQRTADGSLTDPFFKPDWSPSLLLCFDYVSGLACYRRGMVLRALADEWSEEESIDYGLALRIGEATRRIYHLARPLLTRGPRATAQGAESERIALKQALARRGQAGSVTAGRVGRICRVRPELNGSPPVTIIVPTRDKLRLLQRCIDSVRSKSSYPNFQIMIVDNESVDPATLDYLANFPGVVYRYPHTFNYARMMNLAVAAAGTELVILLNNDCEVISPDWIEAMLEHCQRPEVAIVGVRLLYPDKTIHHEGITLNRHNAAVAHIKYENYFDLGYVAREVAAVTGACMMLKASVLQDLGGFDERMRIGYNDVDLCLRANERGFSVIYTGYAELYHITGASRGRALPLKDEWHFLERWHPDSYEDPYFSRNLTRSWPAGTGWP